MGDLYLKEDPFNSLEVDRNVEPSVKESVNINAETTKADNVKASEETSAAEHSTENSDKGNFIESLKTGVAESAEILGLNDKIKILKNIILLMMVQNWETIRPVRRVKPLVLVMISVKLLLMQLLRFQL
jgi:hypothetical protein